MFKRLNNSHFRNSMLNDKVTAITTCTCVLRANYAYYELVLVSQMEAYRYEVQNGEFDLRIINVK